MVLQEKELSVNHPDHFVKHFCRKTGGEIPDFGRMPVNHVNVSQYIGLAHSILMEAAGFIREALIDCQLTVIIATMSDNSKDRTKVQYGKLIL